MLTAMKCHDIEIIMARHHVHASNRYAASVVFSLSLSLARYTAILESRFHTDECPVAFALAALSGSRL